MKISIIVPVFNVEKYLRNCIDSIVDAQSTEYELLLIDDGSTDGSGLICDQYARKNQWIRVFHLKNGGPSAARNIGIKYATGDYIQFVDADDEVGTDYTAEFANVAETMHPDIILGAAEKVDANKNVIRQLSLDETGSFQIEDVLLDIDLRKKELLLHYIWNKWYAASFLKEKQPVFREDMRLGEDFIMNCETFENAKNIYLTSQKMYFYFERNRGSLTGAFRKNELERRRVMDCAFLHLLNRYGVYSRRKKDIDCLIGAISFESICSIEYSDLIISRDKFPRDLSEKYDYFIVGSDQVWNPYYDFVAGKCDFLDFAMKYQKISYAASFGVNEIPNERKAEYAKYLKEFKAISVREKQGAKIVKELTNRVAMVVLDPTLLLDADDWQKVEHKSNFRPKNKYAFVYALGEKNERFKRKIEQLSKEYNVFDIRAIQKNGKEIPVGPSEFLYLLRNSEIVLTDSFHATAFSIIFHKKFITFNRTGLNMNSRIESLSDLVDERKHMNEHGDWNCENMIDYQKTDAILEEERKKSMEFLRAALSD